MMKFLNLISNYLLYTIVLGLVYPIIVYGIGILSFPKESKGSLLQNSEGITIGSKWLSQNFQNPKYFSPRPSAKNFEALPSGASNLSATSRELKDQVERRLNSLENKWNINGEIQVKWDRNSVPDELKFASSSGLEPFISFETALWQVPFVAKFRNTKEQNIIRVLETHRIQPLIGIFGRDRVHVVELNLALDKEFPIKNIR